MLNNKTIAAVCISRRALQRKKHLFRDIHNFSSNPKMAAKSGENGKFSPLHRTLLYYPVDQKFARNCSISYGFRDIHTFLFSAKIQDGRQKWQKLKFFHFA